MTEKLIEQINELSDQYYALSQELASISERKGQVMLNLITDHKTRARAEIEWQATSDGSREAYLKVILKGLEKIRGAKIWEYKSNSGIL